MLAAPRETQWEPSQAQPANPPTTSQMPHSAPVRREESPIDTRTTPSVSNPPPSLPSVLPTRRFARANSGITSNDVIASAMPVQLSSGASRSHKLCSDFTSSHAPSPKNESAINCCARRSDSRFVLPSLHTITSPELTSSMLSMPKPISATELAAAPELSATAASTTL